MTINEYISRQQTLSNTLFRINTNGTGHYIIGDKQYTREQFSKLYPLPISFVANKTLNADHTKDWLMTK